MKKLLLMTAIICGMAKMNAQADKGDFEVGAGIGVNIASVDVPSNNGTSTDANVGINIAFVGEYYFSDRWGIKSRLIYDQKGWGNGFVELEEEIYTTDYNLTYLTIPVMANWHFGSTRKWHLNFGPYAGFLLNAEDEARGMDLKEGFKSTDFGIVFGLGYKFPIAENTKLFIEYEEQYGLVDIFEQNIGGSAVVNSRTSFNVGVLFLLN